MEDSGHRMDLGIAGRIRRSRGRGVRDCVANTRVTAEELEELQAAAKTDGKALSEWGREVMLERVRKGTAETALLTELVALRMLMSMVLRSVALGEKLTPEAYAQILAEVRKGKHETAREVLAQYAAPAREQ